MTKFPCFPLKTLGGFVFSRAKIHCVAVLTLPEKRCRQKRARQWFDRDHENVTTS